MPLSCLRRRGQSSLCKIGGRIEVEHHPRILNINIMDALGIGIDHDPRTLVLGRCHQFGEYGPVENHWMAAPTAKTSNNYRWPGLAVSIDDSAKGGRGNHRMISQVDDYRIGAAGDGLGQADLERRKLAARIIWILDDFDSGTQRNRRTNAIGMSSEHDYNAADSGQNDCRRT